MKFIVDAQLPKSLSDFLQEVGFDSIHTLELPLKNKTNDNQIASFSLSEDRTIITKDNDFLESYLISKKPKKLILVKTGNIKNSALIEIFNRNIVNIIKSLSDNSLIELTQTEIVVHE